MGLNCDEVTPELRNAFRMRDRERKHAKNRGPHHRRSSLPRYRCATRPRPPEAGDRAYKQTSKMPYPESAAECLCK